MKEFRYSDVQIEGCAFTLFPMCDEMNINIDNARAVLWAMHIGAKTIRKDGYVSKYNEKVIETNPILPNVIYKKNFRDCHVEHVEEGVKEGLLKNIGKNKYEITEKMQEVLQKAADKHKYLQGKH